MKNGCYNYIKWLLPILLFIFINQITLINPLSPLNLVNDLASPRNALKNELFFLENDPEFLNESISGSGDGIVYDINIFAHGERPSLSYLSADEFSPINQTLTNITVPQNSEINQLNFSIDEFEKTITNQSTINNSIYFSPSYLIKFTNNSLANVPESNFNATNWINITIPVEETSLLKSVNLSIDNTEMANYSSDFSEISFNHNFTFSEQGKHNVSIAFFSVNSSLVHYQNFSIYHTNNSYSIDQISEESSILNPFITLDGINNPYMYWNLSVYDSGYFSSFSLFSKFSGILRSISISIVTSESGEPTNVSLISKNFDLINHEEQWNTFTFSDQPQEDFFLPTGVYFIRINASNLIGIEEWSIFTTYIDLLNQNTLTSPNNTNLTLLSKDLLFEFSFLIFSTSTLANIELNATVYNNSNPIGESYSQIFSVDDKKCHFIFESPSLHSSIVSDVFLVEFTSNISCRFNFTYQVDFNRSQFTDPFHFESLNIGNHILWNNTINFEPPLVMDDLFFYIPNTLSCFIHFPSNWYNISFNSSNFQNFTSNSSYIFLNSTVASKLWNISAYCNFSPIQILIPDNNFTIDMGSEIQIQTLINSSKYNVSLSFWNVSYDPFIQTETWKSEQGFFLDYYEIMDETQEIDNKVTFPSFNVPINCTEQYILAKIQWHNGSTAGIQTTAFLIRQKANTLISTTSIDLMINSWNDPLNQLTIRYYSDQINISNANLTCNWLAGNWSYQVEDSQYLISLYANSSYFLMGTKEIVDFEFSHENYTTEIASITVFIVMNTTIDYSLEEQTIYYNQTISLEIKWYDVYGNAISDQLIDLDREIDIRMDGQTIPTQWWEFKEFASIDDGSNIIVKIFTDYYNYDFIGNHLISISLLKANNSVHFETQTFTVNFQVLPTPSYLSFQSSEFYSVESDSENSGLLFKDFFNYSNLIDFDIYYEYNATFLQETNQIKPFNLGKIEGYLYDPINGYMIGDVFQFQSLYDGIVNDGLYRASINISQLEIGEYQIVVISTTLNFDNPDPLFFKLEIIPKWDVIFTFQEIISAQEGQLLNWTSYVYFSNGITEWPAAYHFISFNIEFWDVKGEKRSFSRLIYTDNEGKCVIDNVIVPNWKDYEYVLIRANFLSNRYAKSNDYQVLINISPNSFERYWKPSLIFLGIVLLGIPLVLKTYPFIKKEIHKSPILRMIEKVPIVKRNIEYREKLKAITRIDPKSLEAIELLKVPLLSLDQASTSCIDDNVIPSCDTIPLTTDPIPLPDIRRFINQTIQELQEVFSRTKISVRDLKAQKNQLMNLGYLLERQGKYYKAILTLYLAREIAQKLDLSSEIEILTSSINQLNQKITNKQQKLLKKKINL